MGKILGPSMFTCNLQQRVAEIADECCTFFAQLDVYKCNLRGNDLAGVTQTFAVGRGGLSKPPTLITCGQELRA